MGQDKRFGVAVVGCGTVGGATAQLLQVSMPGTLLLRSNATVAIRRIAGMADVLITVESQVTAVAVITEARRRVSMSSMSQQLHNVMPAIVRTPGCQPGLITRV